MRSVFAGMVCVVSAGCSGSSASGPVREPGVVYGRQGPSSGGMTAEALPVAVPLEPAGDMSAFYHSRGAISVGQVVTGQFTASDTRLPSGPYYDDYTLMAPVGARIVVTLTATGDGMDMYLYVLRAGTAVASNDDGGGGLNSRLQYTVDGSGPYVLRASTYGSRTVEGAYTLEVAEDHGPRE